MDASRLGNQRAKVGRLLAGLLAVGGATSAWTRIEAAEGAAAPITHYTQGTFRIPFRVSPDGRCPESLDLLVSRDSGRTWQVHQSAAPAESAFQVTQADEGEFLVKVQARDARAAAVSRSMMKLIVDRTPPKLHLTCDWQPDTGLSIECSLHDRHLDSNTIALELRTNRQPQFIRLQTTGATQQLDKLNLQALPQLPRCESFELRLSAIDLAGNRQSHSQRYRHPEAPENSELLPAYEETPPVDSAQVTTGDALQIEPNDWSTVTLAAPVNRPSMHLTGYTRPTANDNPPTSAPIELTPPVEPTVVASAPASEAVLELTTPEVVSAKVPRVESQSRRLTLGYQFDQHSPDSIISVELWCSVDQGQTWSYWGNDQDRQSPCRVEVDQAGEYHFRIVSLTGPQDQALRPSAGDSADIIVNVLPEKPKPAPPVRLQPVN